MRRILLTLLIAISSVLTIQAQGDESGGATVVRAEYFFDSDPGYGNATIINNVTEGDNELSLSVEDLSPGAHMLYVRSQASSGVWSSTQSHPLLLLRQRPAEAVRVEYFYDTDPGYGNGVSVGNLTDGDNTLVVSVAGLAYGVHHLCLRAQDNTGVWSQVATYSVFVTSPTTANAVRIEYFFDTDPGFGQATSITPSQDEEATYALSLDNLSMGAHMLYLRVQDNHGRWSAVQKHPIYVLSNLPDVVAVEYFFDDNDPGEGQATAVPLSSVKTDPFAFEANTAGLVPGEHHLMVRLQKNNGFWTLYDAATFTVEGVAEPEPYAVLSDNNTVLTFYYDEKKAERNGMSVGPFERVYDESVQNYIIKGREWNSQAEQITKVVFDSSMVNDTTLTSTAYWFYWCLGLTSIENIKNLNTSNVTDMRGMFFGCNKLTNLDVSGFNTIKVTDMRSLFSACTSLLSLDVSGFNTTNVTDMSSMFERCNDLTSLDVSGFNTANVTDMGGMFLGCSGLTSLDVSHFDTENVTDMGGMFSGCTNLPSLDVSGFNTANVTNMGSMFRTCSSLTSLDVSGFNTVNVTNMNWMFYDCPELTTIYAGSEWSTDSVTNSTNMFTGCTKLVGGKGTTYDADHIDKAYAHIDGGMSNPGYFTDKNAVPEIAEAYAALSENNTVLTFYYDDQKEARNGMNIGPFRYVWDDSSYQYVISGRDWTDQVGQITKVVFDSSFAQNTTLTSTAWWFDGCSNLAEIEGIGNLKTDNVTSMYSMFSGCSSLTSLDVSGFTTDQVKDMSGMFSGCSGLTSLDVSHFTTDNVTDMSFMFEKCSGLTTIDLGNFRTEKLTNLNGMFSDCSQLVSINMSGFAIDRAGYAYMFTNCSSLAAIQAGGANIPDEQYAEIGNPNLLVYVNEASQAPQSVQNVVVRDFATTIILTDEAGTSGNNNFYVPRSFTAEMISYTHEYRQQTVNGVSRGWESIVLPFTVQTIVNERNGVIAPFGNSSSDMHFWLRQLSSDGIIRATQIEANRAYLISMPNNEDEYAAKYNQNGRVTFSSENALVPATVIEGVEGQIPGGEMVTLMPNFLKKDASDNLYALNVGEERLYNGTNYPEGSVFERGYRGIRPFEAYTIHHGNSPAPQFISISDMTDGGNVTGIDATLVNSEEVNGEKWYSVNGQKLQKKPTQKGVYLHNGRKVIVR